MKRLNLSLKLMVFGLIVLVLAACGEKSQEDVVGELQKNVEEMSGYKAAAEMSMNTGQEEQKFNIDIWHQKEDFYRVALTSEADKKGKQIILKNKEGVFVLTPALEKSFKFQTEWPNNGSQPYLYQSLIEDIAGDEEATFKSTENSYIFKTKTNYQSNNNLPFQEVHFDKKTYTPTLVKVLDKDENALVEVKFSNFELNPTFKKDDFSMEKNMPSNDGASKETSTEVEEDTTEDVLEVVMPEFTAGAEVKEQREVDLENGKRIISTFAGEKHFTLIQERLDVVPTLSSPQEVEGDIVNLGNTIAALDENKIEWNYNGVNYQLSSEELTKEELIQVAQSVQVKAVK
ncbi:MULTISPECIES: LolA family protein [Bacillaceae]|uniref:Sporulation protein n=1 Tax=Oceanobacillus caeni TaxID=405946 RepID=A0ABR5MJB2_9BACI|nr:MULTISPECIES: outer membrane lipoprotein carrier protein LolA [Bacillaceae]KPH75639.1 sporulation protein [Oceanobacillus caeni]MED4473614.1 outer membrane lipoprotein carrier protein LolA [Oceanobacillus caeni]